MSRMDAGSMGFGFRENREKRCAGGLDKGDGGCGALGWAVLNGDGAAARGMRMERSRAEAPRQVSLRSLTAFFFDRFAMEDVGGFQSGEPA